MKNKIYFPIFLVLLASLVLLSGCTQPGNGTGNGAGNGTGNGSSSNSVSIENLSFNPSELTINAGDTVVWTNRDSTEHTITSDSGSELSSGQLSQGGTYSHTFSQAGTFEYHCSNHPQMKAKVIVKSNYPVMG